MNHEICCGVIYIFYDSYYFAENKIQMFLKLTLLSTFLFSYNNDLIKLYTINDFFDSK